MSRKFRSVSTRVRSTPDMIWLMTFWRGVAPGRSWSFLRYGNSSSFTKAKCRLVATDALHQAGVKLSNEPQRERQVPEPFDPVLERRDVVAHLSEVVRASRDGCAGLGRQQLAQGCLGALDPTGEDRLPPQERPDQEVWVG